MIRAEPIEPKPKKRGLRDSAEEVGTLYYYAPDKIHVQEGWNSRICDFDPKDEDDMALALSIAENGVRQPLTAFLRNGLAYITDGHRRLAAARYAIAQLDAKDLRTLPVQAETKGSTEAERVLSQIVRNQGKPLAPIEKAAVYAKLIGFGWSEAEIAKKVGATRQHVSGLLQLRAGPAAVVEMVKAGEVSAGLAMETLREKRGDGAAATATLYEGLKKAQAEGKSKATRKNIARPAPDLTKSVAYQAGLRRAVEVLREVGMAEAAELVEGEMQG